MADEQEVLNAVRTDGDFRGTTWTMKDGSAHPTGFRGEEFVRPHEFFTQSGHEVTVTTPGGRTPVVDELSLSLGYNNDDADEVAFQRQYIKDHADLLSSTLPLEDARAADYDVLFSVGGHGPMQDLAVDPSIGPLMAAILDDPNKIVSAVCHGPATMLSASRDDGTWLFKDREMTGFTNEEETQATFAEPPIKSGAKPHTTIRLAGERVRQGLMNPLALGHGGLLTYRRTHQWVTEAHRG